MKQTNLLGENTSATEFTIKLYKKYTNNLSKHKNLYNRNTKTLKKKNKRKRQINANVF